jgi:hypothetical protein
VLNHLKTIFFFVLCIGLGAGIGKAYIWFTHARGTADFSNSIAPPLITGVGDAPTHRGFTLTAASLGNIAAIVQQSRGAHATTVGLEYSPELTPSALSAAVRAAHEKNLALALLPPPVFSSQDPFPKPLPEIATEAQTAGVDILCISWLNAQADSEFWRQQCQALRPVYKGQIILAATPDIVPTLTCWDTPDLIGVIGPVALPRRLPSSPDEVTVHDLRVAWDCALTSMESVARVYSTSKAPRRIALLRMNVPVHVSARLPAVGAPDQPPANPALQKMLYEALLLETKGRSAYTDMLLFNYENKPGQGDAAPAIPGLLANLTDAWDPKKPAPVEPASQMDAVDWPDEADFDLNAAEAGVDGPGDRATNPN